MSERDIVSSPKPSQEPSTQTPAPGMTRVRFFKIWSTVPGSYDAILKAYKQAPLMPVVQIPRVAVEFGEKVEVVDADVPSSEVEQIQDEPILRGDGIRILRRATEAVIIFPLETLPSHLSGGNSNSYIRPLTDTDLAESTKH